MIQVPCRWKHVSAVYAPCLPKLGSMSPLTVPEWITEGPVLHDTYETLDFFLPDPCIGLAFDPGTSSAGVRCEYISHGICSDVLRYESVEFEPGPQRVHAILSYCESLLDETLPDFVVIEVQLAMFRTRDSDLSATILMTAAAQRGIPVLMVDPNIKFVSLGISIRDKDKKKDIVQKMETRHQEDGDMVSYTLLRHISGKKTSSGKRVSASKQKSDMADAAALLKTTYWSMIRASQELASRT